MQKQEAHKHDYTKLDFIREVGTTDDRVINRIILGRRCSCDKFQAFEMGDKQAMRELYKRLVREGKSDDANRVKPDDQRISGQADTQSP